MEEKEKKKREEKRGKGGRDKERGGVSELIYNPGSPCILGLNIYL